MSIATSLLIGVALTGQAPSGSNSFDNFYIVAINPVDVPAREGGQLTELNVEEGMSVQEDEHLAQIDDHIIKMAMEVAANKYRSAEKEAQSDIAYRGAIAQKNVYLAELEVAEEANKKVANTFSKTDIRRLRFQMERGELSAEQARHEQELAHFAMVSAVSEYKQAKAMVEMRKIVAPVDGEVTKVFVRKGNWVQVGEPVVRVVPMDHLRVRGTLPASQYSQANVRGKQIQVTIHLAGGESKRLTAKIGFASDEVNEHRDFEVWAEFNNEKRPDGSWLVSPGVPATVTIP